MSDFHIKFRNSAQEEFFFMHQRNKCFSGGYGNGKTFVACQIAVLLCSIFPGYRIVIARKRYTDLKKTTMKTFFKVCPREFIESHNNQEGLTTFINGSEVLWLHLDAVDEMSLRGLEINTVIIDQGEEIEEAPYLTLDARIGRWDGCVIPEDLPFGMKRENFPTNVDGKPIPPSYMIVLCNPDSETHWIWRRYHPESIEWQTKWHETHGYVQRGTDPNSYSKDTYAQMMSRDPEWVSRFVEGKWGISEGAIHIVRAASILHVSSDWVKNLVQRSALTRSLDHGDTAATCCAWSAYTPDKQIIFYREYYVPDQIISYHRTRISELSKNEYYYQSVADPSIFRKAPQKNGAFWTVADEYSDRQYGDTAISWNPADNDELGTRNRINELLTPSHRYKHPLTGESPAPGLYFIAKDEQNPMGCEQLVLQTKSQKRKSIGSLNGKELFSDERDGKVVDHAYDTVRYTIALHLNPDLEVKRKYPPGSMGHYKEMMKEMRRHGYYDYEGQ